MKKKYGSTMRWFDLIAGQLQTRKIKCYDFKRRIKEILKDTIHEVCADSICLKFPKVFIILLLECEKLNLMGYFYGSC